MSLETAQKAQIIKSFKRSNQDTASSEVQIALLTARIQYLTKHLKVHKHDFHTQYGLTKLVSSRRKILSYLKRKDRARYQTIVKSLEIRG